MNKFERVLSADDIFELHESHNGCVFKLIESVEQAVLAKIVDKKPLAWLHKDTHDLVNREFMEAAPAMHQGYSVPLYAINVIKESEVENEANTV